jgi:hypothetical protein
MSDFHILHTYCNFFNSRNKTDISRIKTELIRNTHKNGSGLSFYD